MEITYSTKFQWVETVGEEKIIAKRYGSKALGKLALIYQILYQNLPLSEF